jgi:cbb3-type cytochrome oxidase subunit 3
MLGWLIRILLLGAGIIAGWFVPRDQLGYTVIQMVIVLVLIVIASVAVIYFPARRHRKNNAAQRDRLNQAHMENTDEDKRK